MKKILSWDDEGQSVPLVLDRYLGPHFLDKMPLFYNFITIYALLGLITGLAFGTSLWFGLRLARRTLDSDKLTVLYSTVFISFAIFLNLIIWLNGHDAIETYRLSGLLINSSLIANALVLSVFLYRLKRENSLKRKNSSPNPGRLGARAIYLFVGFLTCMTLVLNQWVYAGKGSYQSPGYHGNDRVNQKPKDVNVILISIDSLRADHLGCYGYRQKTTPHIDAVAREGITYSKAFSTTSWTLPSHVSMLTSMNPEAHGVIMDYDSLDEHRITLAEVLQKEGYSTAGFVSGPFLSSRYGFNQGFQHYDDFTIRFGTDEAARRGITSPKLTEAIIHWLENNYRKKFFLFLHYWDVHYDYVPPPPYNTMFDPDYQGVIDSKDFRYDPVLYRGINPRDLAHIIALYDGEIAFTDKYIGDLLSALKKVGVFDNTMIIITADHGEEFLEHGNRFHRMTLYDEVVRVPLVIKFPSDSNLEVGRKMDHLASIIDIMPTILDYLGIKGSREMEGVTLLPFLKDDKKSYPSLVYSSLEYQIAAVRSSKFKFIHDFKKHRKELYDLVNDPHEQRSVNDNKKHPNLPGSEQHLITLLDWLNAQLQFYRALPKNETKKEVERTQSEIDELKSLGYIQ